MTSIEWMIYISNKVPRTSSNATMTHNAEMDKLSGIFHYAIGCQSNNGYTQWNCTTGNWSCTWRGNYCIRRGWCWGRTHLGNYLRTTMLTEAGIPAGRTGTESMMNITYRDICTTNNCTTDWLFPDTPAMCSICQLGMHLGTIPTTGTHSMCMMCIGPTSHTFYIQENKPDMIYCPRSQSSHQGTLICRNCCTDNCRSSSSKNSLMNRSNKEIDKNRMSNLILLGSISMGIVRDIGSQSNIIPKGMLCIELRYFCKLNKEMNMVDSYCLFHSHNSHWGTDLYTLSELNPRNPIRMTNTMSDLCTVCMEIYMANKVLKNY